MWPMSLELVWAGGLLLTKGNLALRTFFVKETRCRILPTSPWPFPAEGRGVLKVMTLSTKSETSPHCRRFTHYPQLTVISFTEGILLDTSLGQGI